MENNFDKLINQKLDGFEVTPPSYILTNIKNNIDLQSNVVKNNFFNTKIYVFSILILASVVGTVLLLNNEKITTDIISNKNMVENNTFVQIDNSTESIAENKNEFTEPSNQNSNTLNSVPKNKTSEFANKDNTDLSTTNIEVCGDTYTLNANYKKGYITEWTCSDKHISFASNNEEKTTIKCSKSGNYKIYLSQKCKSENKEITHNYFVTFNEAPKIDIGQNQEVCGNECVLKVKGGKTGFWNTIENVMYDDSRSTKPTIYYAGNGKVQFIWTEVLGQCTNTDTVVIVFHENSNSEFALITKPSRFGEQFVFEAKDKNAKIYLWDIDGGITNSINEPAVSVMWESGSKHTIKLTTINDNNCSSIYFSEVIQVQDNTEASIESIKQETNNTILAPDYFSPNNDGMNDIFKIKINEKDENIVSFKCAVFSRNGAILYKWTDYNSGWDGKVNKINNVDEGVYFYTVETLLKDSTKPIVKTGTVTLMR